MNPVAAAQQMALQNQMFQQRREAIRSSCMTKLMQFSEYLSGIPVSFPSLSPSAITVY